MEAPRREHRRRAGAHRRRSTPARPRRDAARGLRRSDREDEATGLGEEAEEPKPTFAASSPTTRAPRPTRVAISSCRRSARGRRPSIPSSTASALVSARMLVTGATVTAHFGWPAPRRSQQRRTRASRPCSHLRSSPRPSAPPSESSHPRRTSRARRSRSPRPSPARRRARRHRLDRLAAAPARIRVARGVDARVARHRARQRGLVDRHGLQRRRQGSGAVLPARHASLHRRRSRGLGRLRDDSRGGCAHPRALFDDRREGP